MIKCILFDWDGVLCNSAPVFWDLLYGDTKSFDLSDFQQLAVTKFDKNEKLLKGRLRDYENHFVKKTLMFPFVIDILNNIRHNSIHAIIVSNAPASYINYYLLKYCIDKCFDMVFSSDYKYRKPDNRIISQIIHQWGLEENEIIYVGDEVTDIECIKSLKCKLLLCSYGFHTKERLQKALDQYLITDSVFIESSYQLFQYIQSIIKYNKL